MSGLTQLISRIDDAVRLGNPAATTTRIKQELEDAIRARTVELPERFHRVLPDRYARRLLHRNDALGYTAVVMTWGPGQRTPLHDHAGIWCVEGVVQGRMDVTQFDLVEDQETTGGHEYRFEDEGLRPCRRRVAGCLIPPFEYHVLANAARRAVDHAPRLRRRDDDAVMSSSRPAAGATSVATARWPTTTDAARASAR